MRRLSFPLLFVIFVIQFNSVVSFAQPKEKEVLDTMKKATDFMMNSVSNRGGFLSSYSADLSEQWGEVPARKSMIWVQDPGTVGVGMMLLDAYKATDDPLYLRYAEKAANALIWGQHPSGGWHYFIDFDMSGVQKWYDEVGSKCWGWNEFYHYYGNCTFDDDVTTGSTRFLMELYMTTLDPKYRISLINALDFILMSQYPNGGWPQRYPLSYEHPQGGHPDYTSFYTFNDYVIQGNIYLLLEAWKKLGNEVYKEAAYRGMNFVIISQYTPPQAGWGEQHDMEMRPAQGRSYEPPSVAPHVTNRCIRDLMNYYKITGDKKYLKGIPAAIEWLENSYLPEDQKLEDWVTHGLFYELGTNKPLYSHREGTSVENSRYWNDYNPKDSPDYFPPQTRVDVAALKKEYERVNALTPQEAMAEYLVTTERHKSAPEVDPETIKTLITSLDDRGAWITQFSYLDFDDYVHNPRIKFMGISTRTYINNMRTMLHYISALRGKK